MTAAQELHLLQPQLQIFHHAQPVFWSAVDRQMGQLRRAFDEMDETVNTIHAQSKKLVESFYSRNCTRAKADEPGRYFDMVYRGMLVLDIKKRRLYVVEREVYKRNGGHEDHVLELHLPTAFGIHIQQYENAQGFWRGGRLIIHGRFDRDHDEELVFAFHDNENFAGIYNAISRLLLGNFRVYQGKQSIPYYKGPPSRRIPKTRR